MLAAQRLGRPVKWVATRSEIFLSDNHGRGLTLSGELALARDGRFLALRFEDRADLGAFSTPFGPQIGSRNITITMGGVYRIPAMHAHTLIAYSSAVPVSAYRGAGRPDIACAIERLVVSRGCAGQQQHLQQDVRVKDHEQDWPEKKEAPQWEVYVQYRQLDGFGQ